MRKFLSPLFAVGLVLSFSAVMAVPVAAATINVPGDYGTIQAAIDAANAGDTINVAAGTYYENITLKDGVEVLGAGADVTTINGGGSGSVVTANDVDSATKLDGFTITNGSATYGGGMHNNNSSPMVTDCTFSGNTATDYGGGGGMYNDNNSSPTVTGCTFSGNTATGYGGGMSNFSSSSPAVTNCTFSGNSANNYGGGMSNINSSSPAVSNCTFSGNTAWVGGGMCNLDNSSPTVTNCTFSGNSATDYGGGMHNISSSSPTVTNCTFSGNSATYGGGGMSNFSSSPTVTNCTFSGNSATGYGGGGMSNINSSSPAVTNCILWDGGDEIYNDSSTPVVTYCDVQGGYVDGSNIIDADPMFVNPGAGDYHLQSGSPCIDVGDNTAPSLPSTDFEGDPRIVDGDGDTVATVDMGADEYFVPPPVGGELYPVNKLSILAPWLALAVLLAVGGGFMIIRRRQAV